MKVERSGVEILVLSMIFSILGITLAVSQELPIKDGAYLSEEHCDMAESGELDMVSFMVEQGGRAVLFEEAACLVAEVNPIRGKRYDVELDCREFGDLYQHHLFLDVVAEEHIRVDGEDRRLCRKGFLANFHDGEGSIEQHRELIDRWAVADEGCSGGFGDDPETDIACARRQELVEELNQLELCYGQVNQTRNEFDWHHCGKGSIR